MNDLVFANRDYSILAEDLLREDAESCAVLLASVARKPSGDLRLLVRRINRAPSDAYSLRGPLSAQLRADYFAPIVKQARGEESALVFVHTHPGDISTPRFSRVDDDGERVLVDYLLRRIPNLPHSAMVLGPAGCRARIMKSGQELRVIQAGPDLRVLRDPEFPNLDTQAFERQIRAFGRAGQAVLNSLSIGIVGLGGTGSVVAQQLAYLGVRKFLLIDPDEIEITNLNRLVGANPDDVGQKKVGVIAKHIKSISPSAEVTTVDGSVLEMAVAKRLVEADFFFCCTDSHGSRAVLGQLAYQYLIPSIDVGVSIKAPEGIVRRISGRVQMLSPGLGCLTCGSLLDSDAVRRDLMTPTEREADPYFIGPGEPQPSVVSLNSAISSLAVTMFLGAVTGIPIETRYQNYDAMSGSVRPGYIPQDPGCVVCSSNGALGHGDDWPLPARRS